MTEEQRQSLVEILDQLIPANTQRGIPGAGAFGTDSYLLATAEKNSLLSNSLQRILALTAGSAITTELVQSVESELPEEFQILLSETYKGYYSQAAVRDGLGLNAQPVHPVGYTVATESPEFIAKLTAPVVERGECYRDTKDLGGS